MYLSGVILEHTCQERLCEEEPRDPEIGRSPLVNPFLHELQPFNQIVDIASERFEAGVRHFEEQIWNLVVEETVENDLELLAHHHEAVDSFVHVDQVGVNCFEQFVEPHEFLLKDSVH